ncbi:hypothetical protein KO561_07885 [Radiobacillus kanasensis]|uniref:hypothetical protein n=1 Tax=Radiobacillus kanasensis TaxID=2844358 RepID=UPI001E578025|nr:hypothetical protein [Radiobacillus kanasensis]UFU00841.1 hypothetical protein KO561_07885 [Radiobacillus kanasensis]
MHRLSIVPFHNVLEVYKSSHHTNDMDALKHLEKAYEKGMEEVIREIAITALLKYEEENISYPTKEKANKEAIYTFNHAVNLCSNNELKNALFEIDSAYNHCAAIESETHFIEGFILGYKYIKSLNESYYI